jgi:4'-phosphopantetheinyl transferase
VEGVVAPQEAVLWYVEPARLGRGDLEACLDLLAPDEFARWRRIRRAAGRRDYLVARALVRCALSAHAAISPRAWRFVRTAGGKPVIDAPALHLCFSLTHTAGLVACLVAPVDAGVDAESLCRPLDVMALARRYLSAVEVRDLADFPRAYRKERFLQLWTLKEAYLKARGLGLGGGLGTLSVFISAGEPVEARMEDDDPTRWQLGFVPATDRHVVAYALRGVGVAVCSRPAPVALLRGELELAVG